MKNQLSSEFEMKDLGKARKILGMEIERDRRSDTINLSQKSYLKKLFKRFGLDDKAKPVTQPLARHFKLNVEQSPKTVEEQRLMAEIPYTSAAGSLMYAMVCTRPDISQAVSVVSRYMHNPGTLAVKWILRYI